MEQSNINKINDRMKRLIYDEPEGNYEAMHNTAIIKNRSVYLRNHGEDGQDICIVEWFIKNVCRKECGEDVWGGIIPAPEDFDIFECALNGCAYASLHLIAIGAAEMRGKLSDYESAEEKELLVFLQKPDASKPDMNYNEAIRRIKDHIDIHFKNEYPKAQLITQALNMAVNALVFRAKIEATTGSVGSDEADI